MVVVGLIAGSLRPSRGRRSNLYFSDTVLHLESGTCRMHPFRTYVSTVAYSSTRYVSGTYLTGVLGSRAYIWMYVARYLKGGIPRELGPEKPKVPVTYMEQTHKTNKQTI